MVVPQLVVPVGSAGRVWRSIEDVAVERVYHCAVVGAAWGSLSESAVEVKRQEDSEETLFDCRYFALR